ncbi:MAG: hypothetical protein AB7V14_02055 [Kiritimatiellia bacterium]
MTDTLSTCAVAFAVAGLAGIFVWSKCFFLAPGRAGWPMLLANVFYETVEIKLRLRRTWMDFLLLALTGLGAGFLWGGTVAAALALAMGAVWAGALRVELRWRSDAPARQLSASDGRVPLPVPRLIVTLRGPVLRRGRRVYRAGVLPEDWKQPFELMVLNPGSVRPQLPLRIEISTSSTHVGVDAESLGDVSCPEPGQIAGIPFAVRAVRAGRGGDVRLRVSHGDWTWERLLRVDAVPARGSLRIRNAAIRRWKYGARAGFVWRGDNDLYDPATFQSAAGLRIALGLAARFRMPTTVMLSARLSLYPEEHKAFCKQFGWNRHSEEIPGFVRFWREEVDMEVDQEFPTRTDRAWSAEVGNHAYLHYGTHAAADPGNGWTSHARVGQGRYPWLKDYPCDSFAEQRDNIAACTRSIEETLGVRTASYTPPSDMFDAQTARAVEAAGIEVGNETDATKWQKLLTFPVEHHPKGCARLVELTRMLPRDPVNAPQIAMLKFWLGVARRRGRALVFLAHHHLLMYKSNACHALTAELLRHVLADAEGDVYPATLTGMGRYWRDVLSERTRTVQIRIAGNAVEIQNVGDRALAGLPLEIEFGGGRRCMRLVDVPAHASVSIEGGAAG